MPNVSRMGIPRRGLLTVQKSPALYLINSGLDLHLSTLTHGRRDNRYPIKHYYGNTARPGLLRGQTCHYWEQASDTGHLGQGSAQRMAR